MSSGLSHDSGIAESTGESDGERSPEGQHGLLLRSIANRLEGEFGDMLPRDTLEHYVADSYDELSSRAKVLTHIPAFVERFARQRLKALAKNDGLIVDGPPEVLFVCRRNDGTSQMAAALFNRKVGDRAHGFSAGPAPAPELEEKAVHALNEVDIDILGEFPKPITEEVERAADVIVTLDSHDDIAILDGKQYQAWRLPDLHEQGMDGYRQLRNDIMARVAALVEEVVPPAPPPSHVAFDADLLELQQMLAGMGGDVVALARTLETALDRPSVDDLVAVVASDDAIDEANRRIANRVMELIARRQPMAGDLRSILASGAVALHLERIADGIVDVAKLTGSEELAVSDSITGRLSRMAATVAQMTDTAMNALVERDSDVVEVVVQHDRMLEQLHDQLFTDLVAAQVNGISRVAILNVDRASRALKRAGEHALDIVEQAIFVETGEYVELGRPDRVEAV